MGTNGSNVAGGPVPEMGGGMGIGNGQPPATEYTLQGVMRFLQTEWHRHERDRNAWEIEKQEMKSRIATLEGSVRRADSTQRALKKYLAILEKKLKDQAAQLKGGDKTVSAEEGNKPRVDREALLLEKLKPKPVGPGIPGMEGIEASLAEEESSRNELKNFLDRCQAEFTYLMIMPANPIPPRESPPLPIIEDLRDPEGFGMPLQQGMDPTYGQQAMRPQMTNHSPREMMNAQSRLPPTLIAVHPLGQGMSANETPVKNQEIQPGHMFRTSNTERAPNAFNKANNGEWPIQNATTDRIPQESLVETSLPLRSVPNRHERVEENVSKTAGSEPEGWDFNEDNFSESVPASQVQATSNRPDTDVFPTAENVPKAPSRGGAASHRRKNSSMSRRRSTEHELSLKSIAQRVEAGSFKLRFSLRGHLDTVRSVIFSGGGSPGEPEICTAGDDGTIKRFHIPDRHPSHLNGVSSDLDVTADFTHRGHNGAVLSLASWSPSPNFTTGGRAQGDGWIFSGGQDSTIRVWERGRVDPKATLEGHTDAVWALCHLPATLGTIFGQSNAYGSPERILLASGAADGTVRIWAVSAPPQLTSPQPGSGRRGPGGRVRGNSMSSGSGFSNSPQPTTASNSPFHYTLVHTISRANSAASPTCITPLSSNGESLVVSYSDAAVIVYDTRTAESMGSMASLETYNGTPGTSVNAVVATAVGLEQPQHQGLNEEDSGAGPMGGGRAMAGSGVEGVIISGHEDRFVRFFDANSGQCTYDMLAHPAAIASLSLSPDGRELVSAGHDASLRFWSLEKRSCTQEITSHRIMRGEGVCAVVWSQDGRWIVTGGGDGIVKVFAR